MASISRVRRARSALLTLILVGAGLAFTTQPSSASGEDPEPGTRPETTARRLAALADEPTSDGLQMVVNERGRISQSTSGLGTNADEGVLRVRKPAGATVRGAWLAYATTGFSGWQMQSPLTLAGSEVPLTNELLNGIYSYNYFADVTGIVKPVVDAADAGDVELPVTEPVSWLVEGEVLVVVFDDPSVTHDQSVTLLYGALAPSGDRYRVGLTRPIDLDDPDTRLEMSLGVTFGYQGSDQFSTVAVNGLPLSSAAGGQDDGEPADGALITVGGLGDSTDNPADPMATPSHARSDDELYDLRPFVKNGDRTITVDTTNPSYDDNVMLATFTMNPPVTKITSGADQQVVVALGDSYQSGEGAGSAYDDPAAYYTFAYENGENYPQRLGGQEDTLTPEATSGAGNGCHRAMRNYPKQVAGYLSDDRDVTLVDVTCSGAEVQRGSKPPIVGDVSGGAVDPESQLAQAVDRLASAGLSPEDVDVVTVGMGGNDARFGDLVSACIIPTLARDLFGAYENTPASINFLLKHVVSCKRLDGWFFHASDAIDDLAAKERFAQGLVRQTFPNADIVQLDYPGILPDADSAPAWCGGIGADDIDYADTQAGRINDVIRSTVAEATAENAAIDRRYELVEVQAAFGSNALCPSDPSAALANGISKANFDLEVDRLLHDPTVRPLLDGASDAYSDYLSCVRRLTLFCDPQERLDRFISNAQGLIEFLKNEQRTILANIVKPPSSGESVGARYDRSRGLFHPNQPGIDVLTCYVHNTVAYLGTSWCPNGDNSQRRMARTRAADTVDGVTPSRTPIAVSGPGATLELSFHGFRAGSQVEARWDGRRVDTVPVDDGGAVTGAFELPDGTPGVHTLELRGEGAAGAGLGHEVRVEYPGRPVGGEDYATYITGFEPRPEHIDSGYEPEDIEVSFLGHPLFTTNADPDGGLLVDVPVPWLRGDAGSFEIVARGLRSGIVRRVTIDAVPFSPALWSTHGPVAVSGARATVTGLVHSEGDVVVSGSSARLTGGVERVGDLVVHGAGGVVDPAARRVDPGSRVRVLRAAGFRPGGEYAAAAGAAYHDIPASACVGGVWRPGAAALAGVVHVPCSVQLSGSNLDRTVTIAAEGAITVSGSRITLRPASNTGATLVADGALRLSGAGMRLLGSVFAPDAEAQLSGSDLEVWCGISAGSIRVSGARFTAGVDERCLPD
jgi:hypothetical protein